MTQLNFTQERDFIIGLFKKDREEALAKTKAVAEARHKGLEQVMLSLFVF